jgi:sugar/nucleoside kinase (ribokinase family)
LKSIDIVTYGDLIADILLPIPFLPIVPDQEQLAHGIFLEPGGMGNVLIMARRLSAQVVPVGRLGDDLYGQMIREKLSGEGVDTSSIEVVTGKQTTLAFVFVSDAGEHVFLGVLGATKMNQEANQRVRNTIASARAFYTNGYAFLDADPQQLVIEAMQIANQSGVTVYFDPGPQIRHLERNIILDAFTRTDTLFLTNDEAALWTGKKDPKTAATEMLRQGPKLVVIKLGSEGCLLATEKGSLAVKAFPAVVCDSSGAGDAFDAAFMVGFQNGLSLQQISVLANAAGAATVTKMGAGSRLPGKEEVIALLRQNAMDIPGFLLGS